MHPAGSDDGELARQLSFPLATLLCAVFLWPLPPQLHWIFLCVLVLIVSALVLVLRSWSPATGD